MIGGGFLTVSVMQIHPDRTDSSVVVLFICFCYQSDTTCRSAMADRRIFAILHCDRKGEKEVCAIYKQKRVLYKRHMHIFKCVTLSSRALCATRIGRRRGYKKPEGNHVSMQKITPILPAPCGTRRVAVVQLSKCSIKHFIHLLYLVRRSFLYLTAYMHSLNENSDISSMHVSI